MTGASLACAVGATAAFVRRLRLNAGGWDTGGRGGLSARGLGRAEARCDGLDKWEWPAWAPRAPRAKWLTRAPDLRAVQDTWATEEASRGCCWQDCERGNDRVGTEDWAGAGLQGKRGLGGRVVWGVQ